MIELKRVYEEPSDADGMRILVDRLWPRGLSKQRARVDRWARELAPSTELRRWFSHDPEKWRLFRERYERELEGNGPALEGLASEIGSRKATLLFAARDPERNNAVVLKDLIEPLLERGRPSDA